MQDQSHPYSEICESLTRAGQGQLAAYLQKLTPESAKAELADEINRLDLTELKDLADTYVKNYQSDSAPASVMPALYYALNGDGPAGPWDSAKYREKGENLIRQGKVGCFTVAGGQGSRLGYDGPKGCYPTSCINEKPLFQIFAETILKNQQKYGCQIPWYIMTSPLNHDATVSFFKSNSNFGLNGEQVMFFQQGVMPSLDASTGDLLLRDATHLATNPDGHGGSFKALHVSGALTHMLEHGIEHVSYFQVDNPHARIIDPVFLGLHAYAPDSSGEFSSKMVSKVSWDEKVGVFCKADGRTQVIEYSDLDEQLAKQTNANGNLSFNAGSIAIHAISVGFIQRVIADSNASLPYHRASKKVPYFDPDANVLVQPESNNAVKLEKFVFDGIPIADKSIVVETSRLEEFAPVKNASGTDSIVSSKQLQTERAAVWLSANGVEVPRRADGSVDAVIEISPLTAVCPDDLASIDLPTTIPGGSTLVL